MKLHTDPDRTPFPFKDNDLSNTKPWLPSTEIVDERYDKHLARFESMLSTQLGSRAVEDLASAGFKSMILSHLKGTQRSEAWEPHLASHRPRLDLYHFSRPFTTLSLYKLPEADRANHPTYIYLPYVIRLLSYGYLKVNNSTLALLSYSPLPRTAWSS